MLPPTVNLYVFVALDDGRIVRAGRLLVENLHMAFRGGYNGVFQYDSDFLNHNDRYALDPANLKLSTEFIRAGRPESGLHGVFQDSLPGKWGNRLLAYKAGFHQQHYTPAHLLEALGNTGIGALLYSSDTRIPSEVEDPSIDFADIALALEEAVAYENQNLAPMELKFLITGGYSAGGARPKLLVKKDGYCLAKFSSIHDRTPSLLVDLEAAGLELGRRIGLEIPDFEVCQVRQRPVLLVKRFDVTAGGGRRALLSFASLLDKDPALGSYSAMAEVIRRYSQQPRIDLKKLFKQMIINVAIHNTDDHLQNFSMIHDSGGWRLSPVYDLTPSFLQNEQATMIDGQVTKITTESVINEGKRFGFSRQKVLVITDSIRKALAGWHDLVTDEYARKQISKKMAELFIGIC
ncbi:MAG: type II toxin-antitoxin system HipA family toxin [Thermodesulfobacteriota bacterium]|nr:type II toxin-antitoxin system HipA family toxin [Thermodesulfobacteriota bacterium]